MLSGVGVVLALALLVPAASLAATHPGGVFGLRASNGYRLFVLAGTNEKGVGAVTLFVGRGRSLAVYGVPATVTETAIQADFGTLGRIDVAVVPSGERVTKRNCDGKKIELESVAYQGTIEFHGEGGYADASATSAALGYGLAPRSICGSVSFGMSVGPGVPGAALFADRQRGSESVHLDVRKNGRRKRTRIEARVTEIREGILIERSTLFFAGSRAFGYDPKLRRATVKPPAPFSGHAVFHRGARKGHHWRGNLTIDLPGREDVPVAGAGFGASLFHAEWSESRG